MEPSVEQACGERGAPLISLGPTRPPASPPVHQPGCSRNPHASGIFMEASSHRPDGLLTPLPSLFQRMWGGAENSQASSHNSVFPLTSPQAAAHPELPQQNKRRACHPGHPKGPREPGQRPVYIFPQCHSWECVLDYPILLLASFMSLAWEPGCLDLDLSSAV